ncbi:UNVERIFIED_CONTAM: hypothetical protein K2H54_021217 [Gekko kuhli]
MHAGSYGGYNYNGMDLSISRSTSASGHFGAAASAGAANAAAFAELDETSASSGTEESGSQVASNVARAASDSLAAATPAPEGQSPQIFPWMRKLHISHGTRGASFLAFS